MQNWHPCFPQAWCAQPKCTDLLLCRFSYLSASQLCCVCMPCKWNKNVFFFPKCPSCVLRNHFFLALCLVNLIRYLFSPRFVSKLLIREIYSNDLFIADFDQKEKLYLSWAPFIPSSFIHFVDVDVRVCGRINSTHISSRMNDLIHVNYLQQIIFVRYWANDTRRKLRFCGPILKIKSFQSDQKLWWNEKSFFIIDQSALKNLMQNKENRRNEKNEQQNC